MLKLAFIYSTTTKIRKSKRLSQLLILVSFLVAFAFIRVVTHLQKAGIIPNQHGSFHLHHMVPGIIFILISGYIGLSFWHKYKLRLYMSILFGIGAALTLDEFALWLFLKDVYFAKQGRDSVDVVVLVITLLTISFIISETYDHYFIKKVKKLVKK